MKSNKFLKEISQPLFNNLILIIVIISTIWALILVRSNNLAKFQIIVAFDLFYFVWAIIYHFAKKDLTIKIFVEYSLFAILVFLIAQIIFFWR